MSPRPLTGRPPGRAPLSDVERARRTAQRVVDRADRRAERRAMLNALKLATGCALCGYRAHPAALDFDHVRGEKLFGISQGVRRREWDVVLAEIAKCELVCSNCHRVRTVERRQHYAAVAP